MLKQNLMELKADLKTLLYQGTTAKPKIDELMEAHDANPCADFRTLLHQAPPERWRALLQGLREGKVTSRAYVGSGGGCLAWFLLDFHSNADLLNYAWNSVEDFAAAVRTIRFWDYAGLTSPEVEAILVEELARVDAETLATVAAPAAERKPRTRRVAKPAAVI